MPPPTTPTPNPSIPQKATLTPLPPFQPDLYQRAWSSIPHPTLPLLATGHAKSVTVFSLATLSKHSALTGGHARSVRTVAWQPARGGGTGGGSGGKRLGLVTGSFDATAGLWSFEGDADAAAGGGGGGLEREVRMGGGGGGGGESEEEEEVREWEFNLVLEGHENEVKSLAFSPGGQYLATSSRDKSVWIWEDVSSGQGGDDEDEWETVAVLSEHDGDVKAVAWCPSNLPNARAGVGRQHNSSEVLASASYDDTVRVWREDADGEWVCVAVLEGHGGTVWGLQWEGKERQDGRFPRLMTFSAGRVRSRVWTLRVSGFGGVPSTMRRSLREEWDCTAVLPKVHTRDVYSVSWSADTGLVASTGSDGIIAVYAEESAPEDVAKSGVEGGAENGTSGPKSNWKVLGTITRAHGPYEVNHITWCKRFDPGAEHKGKEEMLVTTGDDGVVRPWQVRIS
uniref:Probable cytosolic iron-sulfur protein assembly protein 1 n=1 Tax=Chaetomium globosum (strain ATCC 6205 / CBS 148.51 / DSM 1962 / NBRC 6347 / NRRL 1970) TaxID=306901 RepID=CIAO1_CHAGB|nr:RecName: Full=Probable cytosolic iron-sulfur protein assembly protein 1 [Chaetomium globosum CBS 148.51]